MLSLRIKGNHMAHRLSRMASTLLTVLASAGSVMPAEAGRFLCRERQIGMLPRGVTPPPPVYVDADSMQDAMEKARPSFSGQYFCIPPAPTREEHAAEVARLNKAVAATAPKTCPAPTDTQASYRYSAPLAAATSSDCDVALEPDEQLFLAGFLTEGDGACNWGLLAQGRSTYLFGAQAVASGGGIPAIGRETVGSHITRGIQQQKPMTAAYSAGIAHAKALGCGPLASALRDGALGYLDRTGKDARSGRFLGQCAANSRRKLSTDQCSCIAEIVRSIVPAVYFRSFDYKEHVEDIKGRGGALSIALMQCNP